VTTDVVLDSCALAKWILRKADSDRLMQLAADVTTSNHQLIVLDLALIEVTNSIWKLVHRGIIAIEDGQRFVDVLPTLPVVLAESKPC
jgi:predicted nucleic acid-binding protein